MQTIEEVLEYGPICAADMELGFIVTINGAYVNFCRRNVGHRQRVIKQLD